MFFILIKNYTRALFDSIGWYKKIKRMKHTFNIGDYEFYLDFYSSYPRSGESDIIRHYENMIMSEYKNWKIVIDVMINSDLVDDKTIREFIELIILTGRSPYYVSSYINYMSIKTIADIRDEKINKLLSNK